jgi:hypothetical protein
VVRALEPNAVVQLHEHLRGARNSTAHDGGNVRRVAAVFETKPKRLHQSRASSGKSSSRSRPISNRESRILGAPPVVIELRLAVDYRGARPPASAN